MTLAYLCFHVRQLAVGLLQRFQFLCVSSVLRLLPTEVKRKLNLPWWILQIHFLVQPPPPSLNACVWFRSDLIEVALHFILHSCELVLLQAPWGFCSPSWAALELQQSFAASVPFLLIHLLYTHPLSFCLFFILLGIQSQQLAYKQEKDHQLFKTGFWFKL